MDRLFFYFMCAIVLAIGALLFALPSSAQSHHGEAHDEFHGYYQTLQDEEGKSCCNQQDCRPSAWRVFEGRGQIALEGEWVDLPMEKVLKSIAPDRGTHVCAPKQPSTYWPKGTVFCVVLGTGV